MMCIVTFGFRNEIQGLSASPSSSASSSPLLSSPAPLSPESRFFVALTGFCGRYTTSGEVAPKVALASKSSLCGSGEFPDLVKKACTNMLPLFRR